MMGGTYVLGARPSPKSGTDHPTETGCHFKGPLREHSWVEKLATGFLKDGHLKGAEKEFTITNNNYNYKFLK